MPTKKAHQCLEPTTSYPSLAPCWQGAKQEPLPGILEESPLSLLLDISPKNSLGQAPLSLPKWPMVAKISMRQSKSPSLLSPLTLTGFLLQQPLRLLPFWPSSTCKLHQVQKESFFSLMASLSTEVH